MYIYTYNVCVCVYIHVCVHVYMYVLDATAAEAVDRELVHRKRAVKHAC